MSFFPSRLLTIDYQVLTIDSLILNIETSTTVCSVAISKNGEAIAFHELDAGYSHAENLHVFIDELLKRSGTDIKSLNAIAVSKGPGSYTGLRIGVSAAKGLAFALNLPLISVDTLALMSIAAMQKSKSRFFSPMIDARRMEVYTALFDSDLKVISPVNALIVDENSVQTFNKYESICFFGNGMSKCRALLSQLPDSGFIENIFPSARWMGKIADQKFSEKNFEDLAKFEPYYLKEFMVKTKAQKN